MGGKKPFKDLQAYIEANRPLSYAEYCFVKYGRHAPGLPVRDSKEALAIHNRFAIRMRDPFSENEMYAHEDENRIRRKHGAAPIRPGDKDDVHLQDRSRELLSAVATILNMRDADLLSPEEAETILNAGGKVGDLSLTRPRFEVTLPGRLKNTTSLEMRRAVVQIGHAMMEHRPDLYKELQRRYDDELFRRIKGSIEGHIR